MLTARGRRGELGGLAGLTHADSIALDPHKALQLPYGVGALMVRDANVQLPRAFQESGSYCPPANGGFGGFSDACVVPSAASDSLSDDFSSRRAVPSLSDFSLELTREARGVQVWLPVRSYGAAAFARTASGPRSCDEARRPLEYI